MAKFVKSFVLLAMLMLSVLAMVSESRVARKDLGVDLGGGVGVGVGAGVGIGLGGGGGGGGSGAGGVLGLAPAAG
ncbi:UNVERIFIED_CONTAM: hypothetical protein Sangu_2654900 [Sesamum angustifolium]|uniref:Glycine-rich protein n=1 Tax=Sesamum angustifolium TaxID=2727405 RepID=A0AAW2J253_9LAMI